MPCSFCLNRENRSAPPLEAAVDEADDQPDDEHKADGHADVFDAPDEARRSVLGVGDEHFRLDGHDQRNGQGDENDNKL